MGDVGIGSLVPQYAKESLTAADFAYWEALYTDGTCLRETDGKSYKDIDRGRLRSFRIIHHGETLIEAFPPEGATGHNLVYRRRTSMTRVDGAEDSAVQRSVLFVFGYAPMGPAFALNIDAESYYILEDGFDPADAALYPPVPEPYEPQNMLKGTR